MLVFGLTGMAAMAILSVVGCIMGTSEYMMYATYAVIAICGAIMRAKPKEK